MHAVSFPRELKQRHKWAPKHGKCANISDTRLHFVVLSGVMNNKKEMKKLDCDIFDTFATHSGLVHDITDPDCWEQNGSTHGCVFAAFKL